MIKVFLITFLIPHFGFTHSGRTNKDGCHNNRKTGDYHCHNKKLLPQEKTTKHTKSKSKRKIAAKAHQK
jgi:hypothetical protein